MCVHLQAQAGWFCKGSVTFFNELQDNELEIVASKLYGVCTSRKNCSGTLDAIPMHQSAAPNSSRKLCDEL